MNKLLILLGITSLSVFSQAGMPPIYTEMYECQSAKVEEHRITIYQDSISKQRYTAMYFDNDDDIQLNCDRTRGQVARNSNFLSCYVNTGKREVLVDFQFSGRSLKLQGHLLETFLRSGDEWESFYRCRKSN